MPAAFYTGSSHACRVPDRSQYMRIIGPFPFAPLLFFPSWGPGATGLAMRERANLVAGPRGLRFWGCLKLQLAAPQPGSSETGLTATDETCK